MVGNRSKKLQSFSDMSKVMNLRQNRDVRKFTLETALLCKEGRHSRRRGKWPSGRLYRAHGHRAHKWYRRQSSQSLCSDRWVSQFLLTTPTALPRFHLLHGDKQNPGTAAASDAATWRLSPTQRTPWAPGRGLPALWREPVPDFRGFSLRI